jgi:formylglycine-generating enzyme required for sulfatase activity
VTGSPPNEPGRELAELQRPVTITKPLYIGVTEVTQDQFSAAVRGVNPSRVLGGDLPVHNVSWDRAQTFLSGLNRLPIGKRFRFRLPTSAEWEYACRAGTAGPYFYGGDGKQLGAFAWHNANANGAPHPVAKLWPNAWGLYDMLGNINEWTDTSYDPQLYPTPRGQDGTGGPTSEHKLARGGSYMGRPNQCRCAAMDFALPGFSDEKLGLRVVCEPITPEILLKP